MSEKDELRLLIDQILAAVREKNGQTQVVHTELYTDEPIARPADETVRSADAQAMGRPASAAASPQIIRRGDAAGEALLRTGAQLAMSMAQGNTPERYAQMRRLAGASSGKFSPDPAVFCRQARFMADHEDDFEYHGEFVQYFPTYQSMNTLQLRGYFSWRTQVRRGNVQPTSLSFVFVYIYELLNLVGEDFPEIAFERLRWFWNAYRRHDDRIDHYMRQWLRDFAVYHNLDRALLDGIVDTAFEETVLVLLEYKKQTPQRVFEALQTLSAYDIGRSRLYRQHPQDVQAVVYGVFAQLSEYYEKNRKNTLCEKLFGRLLTGPCRLFETAVFEDTVRYPEYEYVINPLHIYRCKNGVWSSTKFYGTARKSRELGAILKTVDSAMRAPWGLPPIQPGNDTKLVAGIVQKAIEAHRAHLAAEAAAAAAAAAEAARPKVQLDLSRLSGIRQAAAVTRDKLLVEEPFTEDAAAVIPMAAHKSAAVSAETAAPPQPSPVPEQQPAVPSPAAIPAQEKTPVAVSMAPTTGSLPPTAAKAGLSAAEYAFLHALLYAQPWQEILRRHALLPSVAADAVNEKLFDTFGDTVIVFEDDVPMLLEDYTDELKGMFPL